MDEHLAIIEDLTKDHQPELHPIMISILFHYYKQVIMELKAQVEQMEDKVEVLGNRRTLEPAQQLG
jgi:hypothetical protein